MRGRRATLVQQGRKVRLDSLVLAALKGLRGNKDLSARKGLPVREVKPAPRGLRVQLDHKVRRVKQERKDPQARRASGERQGYRDHQAPRDNLDQNCYGYGVRQL